MQHNETLHPTSTAFYIKHNTPSFTIKSQHIEPWTTATRNF